MKKNTDQPVRVDKKLLVLIKAAAKKEGRTVKGEMERLLRVALFSALGENTEKISG